MYSDADVAALYDILNPWGRSDDFYLAHLLAAPSALDVGCGNGTHLARARAAGHTGRLCGVDPDRAALDRARSHPGIEWREGTAASMTFDGEFSLAIMANNAFQCLVSDAEVRDSLAAIHAALAPGGAFVFETRNPLVRAWESWTPDRRYPVVDHHGTPLLLFHTVEAVAGDVVTLTETTATRDGEPLRVDRADLRFLSVEALDAALATAGFAVAGRYGDFAGGGLTPASGSIVTVAGRG